MSDSVTNVEIEDVLSSIRRLVSDDKRPPLRTREEDAPDTGTKSPQGKVTLPDDAQADTTAEDDTTEMQSPSVPEASEETDVPDKLVLTAALRVVAPEPQEDASAEAQSDLRGKASPERSENDETRLVQQDDGEPAQRARDSDDIESAADVAMSSQDGDDLSDQGQDVRDDAAEVDWQADEAKDKSDPPSLERRIAGVEAAVGARDDHWEPDGVADDDYAGSQVESLPWEDTVSESEQDEKNADAAQDDHSNTESDAAQSEPDENADDAGEDHIQEEEVEAAASPDDQSAEADEEPADEIDDWEPEEELDEALAIEEGLTLDAKAEASDATIDAQASDDNAFDPDWTDSDEAILDEESLREMVSDIVRQELQGALGERITRNVRKLVRREIHRAMASQEFE